MGATRLVVVGGCGHVGLPLGLAFSEKGLHTTAYDTSEVAVANVIAGALPFVEPTADVLLDKVLTDGSFTATTDPECLRRADVVIVVVGTPIDEHLNPNPL